MPLLGALLADTQSMHSLAACWQASSARALTGMLLCRSSGRDTFDWEHSSGGDDTEQLFDARSRSQPDSATSSWYSGGDLDEDTGGEAASLDAFLKNLGADSRYSPRPEGGSLLSFPRTLPSVCSPAPAAHAQLLCFEQLSVQLLLAG